MSLPSPIRHQYNAVGDESDNGNVGKVGTVSNVGALGHSSDKGNVGKVGKTSNVSAIRHRSDKGNVAPGY